MAIKLLVNAIAGGGKTSLLESMGEDTFVISRDGKSFGFPIPHMLVDAYYGMDMFLNGGTIADEDGEQVAVEGITDKLEAYQEKFGKLPTNVVFDSVSQVTLDVLEKASQTPDSWGSQGKEITKELATFTQFIHEVIELNDMNVIMMNHVTEEKDEGKFTGVLLPFGQGQFKNKGAFYATVNESVTLVPKGNDRQVILRGTEKQARTTCKELPDTMWVKNINNPEKSKRLKEGEEYFNLQEHMNYLTSKQQDVKKWAF